MSNGKCYGHKKDNICFQIGLKLRQKEERFKNITKGFVCFCSVLFCWKSKRTDFLFTKIRKDGQILRKMRTLFLDLLSFRGTGKP